MLIWPQGVYFRSSTASKDNFILAYPVSVRETTGAGDTFVGAYAVAVARSKARTSSGFKLWDAAKFANAAAAITVQREGAMSAIPTADEVQLFIKRQDLYYALSLASATDMVGTAHSPEGDELAMVGAL